MADVTYSSGGWSCPECARGGLEMPKAPNSDGCLCPHCGTTGTNEEFLKQRAKIFGRRQIRFMKRGAIVTAILVIIAIAYVIWK